MQQLLHTANTLLKKGKYQAAIDVLIGEEHLFEKEANTEELQQYYISIAENYYYLAQYQTALDYYATAEKLHQAKITSPNITALAELYNNIGACLGELGAYRDRMKYYHQALDLLINALGETHPDLILYYNNLGYAYHEKGDYGKSLFYYEKALEIGKVALEGKEFKALIYNNIGNVYSTKGDFDNALAHHQKALVLWEKENVQDKVALAYNNLGYDCRHKGDAEIAFNHYEKALKIWQALLGEQHPKIITTYINMSNCLGYMQQYETQFAYNQKALKLSLQINNEQAISRAYYSLGTYYLSQKNYQAAISNYQAALTVCISIKGAYHPDTTNRYNFIAKCYAEQKQWQAALQYYQKSLYSIAPNFDIADISQNPPLQAYPSALRLLAALAGKADTAFAIFTATQNKSYLKIAHATYVFAAHIINQIRQTYKAEGSKLNLAKKGYAIYEQAITVCWHLYQTTKAEGYIHDAFYFSEQNKALVLLAGVKEAEARNKVNIPSQTLAQLQELRLELNFFDKQIQQEKYKNNPNEQRVLQLQSERFDVQQTHEKLLQSIHQNYPEYYQLKLNTKEVQISQLQQQLAANTVLLNYFTSNHHYYVLFIHPQKIAMHQIAKSETLVQAVQHLLPAIQQLRVKQYCTYAHQLYQALIAPFIAVLPAIKKLVLILDQALLKIPFEALLCSPNTQKITKIQFSQLDYLLLHFQTIYQYSATLYFNGLNNKTKHKSPDALLGIAPVHYQKLPDLVYSQQQVENVQNLFEEKQLHTKLLLNQQANVVNVLANIHQYKYVLVAAHGILDTNKLALSGIVLSEKGQRANEENGSKLYMSDTYNLNLSANLVVLSCCDSGIGPLSTGEGMMAINRGFMYSGAKNMVFTLYKVFDKEAATLVENLFRKILAGQSYAEAMQASKKIMVQQNCFPKMWAAFLLLGCDE